MAHGIPAVVSPVGANRDLGPEGDGVYFAATDTAWEEKIALLCGSPALRNQCGLRGKEVADKRFSLQAAAGMYQDIFLRLVFGDDV